MNADHALITGSSHFSIASNCQDYASSGTDESESWAMVADGCSSAGRSDLGARAWILSAEDALRRNGTSILHSREEFDREILTSIRRWSGLIKVSDLISTLCVVGGTKDEMSAHILGDGALVKKFEDGSIEIIEVSYSDNAPNYPIYQIDPLYCDRWYEQFSQNRTITTTKIFGNGLIDKVSMNDTRSTWKISPAAERVVAVGVLTDGIDSREGYSSHQTVVDLLDFKSMSGAFVQRKLGSSYRRIWHKQRSEPKDDLSIAMIWIGGDI